MSRSKNPQARFCVFAGPTNHRIRNTARTQCREGVFLRIARVFILIALFLIPVIGIAGRSDKSGTAAAPELVLPVGASSIALGGANLAFISGIEAMYWNPAGAVRGEHRYNATVSHMNYFSDIGIEYVAFSTHVEDVATLGVSAKALSVGEIPVTTADYPDGTGEIASPSFITLSGLFSRMVTDKISFGVAGSYIIEKMEKVSAQGIAFTAGLQYWGLGGIDDLSLGVVVRNIGPALQYDGEGLVYTGELNDMLFPPSQYNVESTSDDLPSTIEVGLGYQTQIGNDLNAEWTAAFQNNNFSADEYKSGLTIRFLDRFSIRGGYTFSQEEGGHEYLFGSSFGIGMRTAIEQVELQFDYCFRSQKYFSYNHVVTLRFGME